MGDLLFHHVADATLINRSQLSISFITVPIKTGSFDHLLIYGWFTGWGISTLLIMLFDHSFNFIFVPFWAVYLK